MPTAVARAMAMTKAAKIPSLYLSISDKIVAAIEDFSEDFCKESALFLVKL